MGDGSEHEREFNKIKIAADGRCRYVFSGVMHVAGPGTALDARWRRAEFVIDQRTLTDLRKLLVDIEFFQLKKEYRANVYDGTQRWAWVRASGMEKGVHCDNHFPKSFMKLYTFVQTQVIRPHELEMEKAPLIDFHEARRADALE